MRLRRALLTGLSGIVACCLSAQTDRADSLLRKALKYREALAIYKQMLESDLQKGNEKDLGKDYNNIANAYQAMGDYTKSTDYYFKALKIAESEGNKKKIAYVNYNIGVNYATMHKDSAGFLFLNKATDLLKAENNPDSILGDCYMALGNLYMEQARYEEAMSHFSKAGNIFRKGNYRSYLANLYLNRSYLELERGNFKEIIPDARKALALFREFNDRMGIAAAYINLQVAHYNLHQDPARADYKKNLMYSVHLLDSAAAAIKDIPTPEHFMTIYRNKSELYELAGMTDSAFAYLKKHDAIKDSVYGMASQNRIDALRIEYESGQKEKENQVLAAESKNKSYLIIIIITSGALLISVLILILFRSRSRKIRKEIEFEKDKLELEQKTLRAQMNPHFMFNAINSIQRYILKKNEADAYDYLAKFSKLMRIVLNNSQEKVLYLSQELEMIRLYVEMEQLRFTGGFDFVLNVDKNIDENETKVPAMLMQPYVENAIWHGLMNLKEEREALLKLDIHKEREGLKIVIEDNGIGREKAKTYNTGERHQSAGMKLTEQRLMMINKMQEYGSARVSITDLCDENQNGTGTRVEIHLPLDGK